MEADRTDQLVTPAAAALRIYPAPWEGELVLACSKCQKKIRRHGGSSALGKVRRWFKRRTKNQPEARRVHVLPVTCVKMCPRDGVTIFAQRQLARQPAGVCILRSEEDLEAFYQSLFTV